MGNGRENRGMDGKDRGSKRVRKRETKGKIGGMDETETEREK